MPKWDVQPGVGPRDREEILGNRFPGLAGVAKHGPAHTPPGPGKAPNADERTRTRARQQPTTRGEGMPRGA